MRTWKSCAEEGIALYKGCQLLGAEALFVESVRRARNDNVAPESLAEALNNLAIVYLTRAKFQDAGNALRESTSLVQSGSNAELRMQRALSMHIRTLLHLEQEHFSEALDTIVEALQLLGHELEFCSSEFWFSMVKAYIGLGLIEKANDAVDGFLLAAPLSVSGKNRIFIDEAFGSTFFGPGWQKDDGTASDTNQIEIEVRALLVRATLKNQLPSQSRDLMLAALELCDQLGEHYLTAQALVFASRIAFGNNKWAESAQCCRRSLEVAEKVYGQSHPALLAYLINTASLTLMTDGLPDCISLMDRTFEIVSSYFGPRHPKYARCQLMWSGLLPFVDADDTEIAKRQEQLIEEALNTFLDYFDDVHSTVVSSKLQLAELWIKTDRIPEAEELLRSVLKDATAVAAINPYPLIGCLSDMLKLSDLLPGTERIGLREEVHRELTKFEFSTISDTGRRIDLMRQVSYMFQRMGDVAIPEDLLVKAYELSKNVDSGLYYRCKQDLVALLIDTQRPDRAMALLTEATDEEMTLAQHLNGQVQLAKVLYSLDRVEETEHLALGAMSQAEGLLPDCSDVFVQLIGILTDLYISQFRLEEAVRIIGILTSHKHHLGVAVMEVIPLSLRLIADAFAQQHDRRAEQLYEQSIGFAEEVQGKAPETLDSCLVAYAEFCLATGQADKAKKLFERWLDLRREICGEESYACAIAMLNVAEINMDSDLGKSLKLSMDALKIVEKERDLDPEYLVAALRLRSAILEKSNNKAEAIAISERARQIEMKELKRKKGDSQ